MRLTELERDAQRVCLERQPPKDALERLGDERIWSLYRSMVRRRLYAELKHACKRTYQEAGDALFARAFDHFMAHDPPRDRRFFGIPCCFAPSASAFFSATDDAPVHLSDLVRFEAARWEVSDLNGVADLSEVGELDFDKPPVFSPALRMLRLQYGVHRNATAEGYPEGPFFVALHRAADADPVKQWQLNATTFALITEVIRDPALTLTEAVKRVSMAQRFMVDQAFLEGLCSVLADFIERGILLGSR